jgi:branched-chain amino acid transport system permease protein
MRAVSQDGEAARLMGINDRRVYATATAIALALVAVAGVLLAVRSTFTPTTGGLTLLFAFEAVVIGVWARCGGRWPAGSSWASPS